MKHVVIIGNGISGISAARHLRKRCDYDISVISAETDHFFSRTALMYVYMGHMKFEHTKPYEDWFWKKNRIDLKNAWVERVDCQNKSLSFRNGESLQYDVLVLATGSKPNKFGWPGQELKGVQGLYSYQDLELLEQNTHPYGTKPEAQRVKRAVIVGGGLIGVELAEMLLTRNIEVTFLVRENRFWGNVLPEEEGRLVANHLKDHHVDLQFETELDEILADENGRCRAVRTKSGEEIDCQLVGLTAGVSPNVDFLRDSGIEVNRGIVVDRFLKTNQADVYAIGDCAEFSVPPEGRRPIEQVWYTGRMMGETVARTIVGETCKYEPGPWFNSAKFFDVEYQTYGRVEAEPKEGEQHFFWQDKSGLKCVRIVFDAKDRKLLGINVFGKRLRHEVIDRWLKSEKTADWALEHWRDVNFDPEFYKKHEKEIVEAFNSATGGQVSLKKKSWKRILNIRA